jgi:predicted dehydrogenase
MSGQDGDSSPLRVGIVGCGRMADKRAAALGADELTVAYDVVGERAEALTGRHGGSACGTLDELLAAANDVVIVATSHDCLAEIACRALGAGSHVLVEKPAGLGSAEVDRIADVAAAARRLVKVGFNHRFHPANARAVEEARSGRFGPVMFMRALYGHGGRLGYEREWRARLELAGGGELVDQGMHLLDLSHWLIGPLPLRSALLRTNFWDMEVEDNAVLVLGDDHRRDAPWSMLHVSWTEWKNMFSLEIYCRTGKLQVNGLAGSYGPQRLRIYTMSPELGPPAVEEIKYPAEDASWEREWEHFRARIDAGGEEPLLGDLVSAAYVWKCVEAAYAAAGWEAAGHTRQ